MARLSVPHNTQVHPYTPVAAREMREGGGCYGNWQVIGETGGAVSLMPPDCHTLSRLLFEDGWNEDPQLFPPMTKIVNM